MTNKRISMVVGFALSLLLLVGCGSDAKTAKTPAGDLLRASVEKQFEMESAHSVTDVTLDVQLNEDAQKNPNLAMLAPFLKDAKLTIDQNAVIKENLAHAAMVAVTGGQTYNADLYMTSPTKMVFQTELIPQPVIMDLEKIQEFANATNPAGSVAPMASFSGMYTEENKAQVKVAMDIFGEAFKGVEPTKREAEEIEFSTGKESLDMMSYSYKNNEEALALFEKVAKNVMESEKMYDLITSEEMKKAMDPAQAAAIPSKEEYAKQMEQAKKDFDAQFPTMKEQFNAAVELKDATVKLGVDADGYMRHSAFIFEATVKQGGMEIPVKFTMTSNVDKINAVKKEDVKTIEVDENNAIDFMDLLMMGMMGGAPQMN
ncbi:MAG: hypothetical protein Q4A72_07940 [Bacillota bacterium]|nr:hypothetical protein [Bacillota bacterium]